MPAISKWAQDRNSSMTFSQYFDYCITAEIKLIVYELEGLVIKGEEIHLIGVSAGKLCN